MSEVRPIQSTSSIPTADVRHITKGDVIVGADGREYKVLSKGFTRSGAFLNDKNDPNYIGMVRAEGCHGFDLVITQGMLNRSAYYVRKGGK
ncbi:hypothetical protein SEA_WALTZ_58 [Arthrobacter phage Waltz]|nr:hypothetical protein SEA_WALTZ_58 [Arthrobacter phage Waltz]